MGETYLLLRGFMPDDLKFSFDQYMKMLKESMIFIMELGLETEFRDSLLKEGLDWVRADGMGDKY